MNIIDIQSKLPWAKSNGRRKLADIVYAVVHHDAELAPDVYAPISRYQAQARYHISKGWGHMSYTYRIDRQGIVYQTFPLEEIGYHSGNWLLHKSSVGICLDGDFTKQPMPTPQADALRALLDYLTTKRPDMPKLVRSTVKTHGEVRPLPTACPGGPVIAFVKMYRKVI